MIVSKFDVLEAEWLLLRDVTIVRDTSAASSPQRLTIGNPNEAG